MWITINEPFIVSNMGYGIGYDAPGRTDQGGNNYTVAHNLLKAHAAAYRLFRDKYAAKYNGKQILILTSSFICNRLSNI